jgi:hypothetical protein
MNLRSAWNAALNADIRPRFKRPGDADWREPEGKPGERKTLTVTLDDLEASDFMLEPQSLVTDLEHVRKAWDGAGLGILSISVFNNFVAKLGIPVKGEVEVNGKKFGVALGKGLDSLLPSK